LSFRVQMVVPQRDELLSRLRSVSLYHPDVIASEAASRCLAGLVNKTSLGISFCLHHHDDICSYVGCDWADIQKDVSIFKKSPDLSVQVWRESVGLTWCRSIQCCNHRSLASVFGTITIVVTTVGLFCHKYSGEALQCLTRIFKKFVMCRVCSANG